MKGHKSVVEKKFIHVRVNISGSPLECPGFFSYSSLCDIGFVSTLCLENCLFDLCVNVFGFG